MLLPYKMREERGGNRGQKLGVDDRENPSHLHRVVIHNGDGHVQVLRGWCSGL
jgi:hypothetical protein